MNEYRKSSLKLKIEFMRGAVEDAEFYMAEIRKRKEEGKYCDVILPTLSFQLGRTLGIIEHFDLPDWCRSYKSWRLFFFYRNRVVDKIRDFYENEI